MAQFFRHALYRRILPNLTRKQFISTSKSTKTDAVAVKPKTDVIRQTDKNWVSYGFDQRSKSMDRVVLHMIFFASVSVMLVTGTFYLAYLPDYSLHDWALREGYLELRRREEAGLPLIDPNLIDPAKITLPSDEELGDTNIII